MKRLICDISNLFWRTVAAQQKYGAINPSESAGLGLHGCLYALRKHYNAVKPDKIAIALEGSKNWRKEYTKSDACYSKVAYKGNRVVDPGMAVLFDVFKSFEDLIRNHSNIVTLQHPILEGDDLIAGYVQRYSALGDEVTILSGDKDFTQLLGLPGTTLLNPDGGKNRTLLEQCGVDDAGYFMFEKCFRGDSGDNVLPALPRVRATKLKKAWDGDQFIKSEIFNKTWEYLDPATNTVRIMEVSKMYAENNLLMNLSAQPAHIRQTIEEVLNHESENHGKFNYFEFNKFLAKHDLKQISEKPTAFVELLSGQKI